MVSERGKDKNRVPVRCNRTRVGKSTKLSKLQAFLYLFAGNRKKGPKSVSEFSLIFIRY
jgi:hypothetical protein